MKPRTVGPVRASISFPPDLYEILEGIAKEKKVSLAWVVRDAVDRYIAELGKLRRRRDVKIRVLGETRK